MTEEVFGRQVKVGGRLRRDTWLARLVIRAGHKPLGRMSRAAHHRGMLKERGHGKEGMMQWNRVSRWSAALAIAASSLVGLGAAPRAQAADLSAKEVRGQPVVVNGKQYRLWVFVYQGKPTGGTSSAYCTDGNQSTTVPSFATANPAGLTFNINQGSIPIDKTSAIAAIHGAFSTWDAVGNGQTYFTLNDTGGAARPAADGNNTIGWARIVPKNTLAATWVWVDPATNKVAETDMFFNTLWSWGVYTTCNAQSRIEVGDIGTHEAGHTVGLDHLKDANAYATMYPSAPAGEVRKRTLTPGDANGYLAVGGF